LSRERLYVSELYLLFMGGQYAALNSLDYTGGDLSASCAASLFLTDALFMRESPLAGYPPIASAACGDPLDSYLWKRRLIAHLWPATLQEPNRFSRLSICGGHARRAPEIS
jgi:hypothetical protein